MILYFLQKYNCFQFFNNSIYDSFQAFSFSQKEYQYAQHKREQFI